MSHWSIEERSESRLVAKSIPHRPPLVLMNLILKILVATAAFCPGLVALMMGSTALPSTLSCKANPREANVMDCRQQQTLGSWVVRSERFQLVGLPDKTLEQKAKGDPGFFLFGLCWVAGTAASIAATRLGRARTANWVFDRTTSSIHSRPVTLIKRPTKTFAKSDVQGLVLEIPDLQVDSPRTDIMVRLNLHAGETPTQYLLWNEHQPVVYAAPYGELAEAIEQVLQPISDILERPWQWKFFHEDECFIFDFAHGWVDRYLNGDKLMRIPFTEIADLVIDHPVVEPGQGLLYLEPETLCYLCLVLPTGESFRVHQYGGFDAQVEPEWPRQLLGILRGKIQVPIAMA
jgi:hypothetical protein